MLLLGDIATGYNFEDHESHAFNSLVLTVHTAAI
jgi:hypothetical protein